MSILEPSALADIFSTITKPEVTPEGISQFREILGNEKSRDRFFADSNKAVKFLDALSETRTGDAQSLFLQTLSIPNVVRDLSIKGHAAWIVTKLSSFNDAQIKPVLIAKDAAFGLAYKGEAAFVAKKLPLLDSQEITTVLTESDVVVWLAQSGKAKLVTQIIDKLNDEQAREVFGNESVARGFRTIEHKSWLEKKMASLGLSYEDLPLKAFEPMPEDPAPKPSR